ncbi:hypothetical protein MTO96_043529 [Rhipicephalus appendiculatus]
MAATTASSSNPPKRTKSLFVDVQGVLAPWNIDVSNILYAIMYRPYPGDVFITAYPCSGGTWLSLLLYALTHTGKHPADYTALSRDVLFLERMGRKVEDVAPPRRLKTHLPAKKLRLSQAAKYVYMVRDYRACCVSLYEQMSARAPEYRFSGVSFEDFFERFIDGQVEDNDYFDHAAPAERLVRDDQQLKELRQLLIYDCSVTTPPSGTSPPPNYLRDGQCYINCVNCSNRWKDILSEEQVERLTRRFTERTKGKPIENLLGPLGAERSAERGRQQRRSHTY